MRFIAGRKNAFLTIMFVMGKWTVRGGRMKGTAVSKLNFLSSGFFLSTFPLDLKSNFLMLCSTYSLFNYIKHSRSQEWVVF